MAKLTAAIADRKTGLLFCNLVDFDMLYGHRKDVEGFAKSLEEFDALLADFLPKLASTDLLLITADHGCDPDPRWETTDHSREYVPILAYASSAQPGCDLGVRSTLADMGQTVAANFGGRIPRGTSFLASDRNTSPFSPMLPALSPAAIWAFAALLPTWGKPSPRILAAEFLAARASLHRSLVSDSHKMKPPG